MNFKSIFISMLFVIISTNASASNELDPILGTKWKFEEPFSKFVTFDTEIVNHNGHQSVRCEDQGGRLSYVFYGTHSVGPTGYIMTFRHQSIEREIDYIFNINPDGLTGTGSFLSCDPYGFCGFGDLGKIILLDQQNFGSLKATLVGDKFYDPINEKLVSYKLISKEFNITNSTYSNSMGKIFIENIDASTYDVQFEIDGYLNQIINDVIVESGKTNDLGTIFFQESLYDSDLDGLNDDVENSFCTKPDDADTDDDGILDGNEDADHNGQVDVGETDPCKIDTDGDGIQDGTELGYTLNDVGQDTDSNIFQPGLDPSSTTDPLNADTDGDGIDDGQEDLNHNGRIDEGERDPNNHILKGDVNEDSILNLIDAVMSMQICCGMVLETKIQQKADVNNDGKIGLAESVYILQNLAETR